MNEIDWGNLALGMVAGAAIASLWLIVAVLLGRWDR